MRKTRLLLLTVIAGLGLTLSACNEAALPLSSEYPNGVSSEELAGEIETPWFDYTVPATSVVFPDEDRVVNINKGETHPYHPTLTPKEATINALTFTSQNLDVAYVVNGVLTAVGGGSTTIVVSSDENSFTPITLEVNVTVPVQEIHVSPAALDLGYGYQEQLHVTYVPADTTQEGVSYEVIDVAPANADVVSVSEDGLVTAGTVTGTAKIKVTSPYLNSAETVTVNVEDKVIHVDSITITNKVNELEVDKQYALEVGLVPSNAEDKGILYESSNPEVAVIDAAGNISTLEEGTTTISAIAHEKATVKETFELTVYAVKADAISVPATVDLILNATEQLHPVYKKSGETVVPSRGALTYSSDKPEIATVSTGGLITAKSVGTAIITVKDTTDPLVALEATVVVNVSLDIATFHVTSFADWTPNDGATVFAWVWGGDAGYPGTWTPVALSYDGDPNDYTNVTGTFYAPRNIDGLVFVRCKAGTTEPDWDALGDEDGRIYNKTEDLAVFGTELVAISWKDYPEAPAEEGFGIKFGNGLSLAGTEDGFDPHGRAQFSLSSVQIPAGSTFTAYNFGEKVGWVIEAIDAYSFCGDLENPEAWKAYLSMSDSEYTALVDITVDIYIKIAENNDSIYFGLVQEPVVGDHYAIKIGDTTTNLVEGSPTGTELKLFHADDVKVTADESVTFYANNVAITANIGPDGDDIKEAPAVSLYNNYKGSVSSLLLIQANNDEADIFLRVYEDGMSFWISGGTSADHDLGIPTEGFGLLFASGANVVAADKGTTTIDEKEYHQYLVADAVFHTGDQFKLYNFEAKAGWVDNVDGYSFNGDSASSEAWKEYLTKGAQYYTVKQDFCADVWMKLNIEGNNIYFGLKTEPIPLASVYKVKLGDASYALDEQVLTAEDEENNVVAKYETNHDVVAGEALAFLGDDVTIRGIIGANSDDLTPSAEQYNNYVEAELDYVTQADAANALIQLFVYRDSYSFWVAGGNSADHEKPGNYYLIGSFNSWAAADPTYKLTKVTAEHYKIENVALAQDDTLKVFWPDGATEPEQYISNADVYTDCGYTLDGDGNIVVSETANYTVELWFDSTSILSGNHVTLTKQVEYASVYSMKINNVDVGLAASSEGLSENEHVKYVKASVAVVAGQTIEMFADGVAIAAELSADGDDIQEPPAESKYNNYIGSLAAGFKVQESGTVDITMHIWNSGWVTFWISGGSSADHTLPEPYYLIGSFNGWTTEQAEYQLSKVDLEQYKIENVVLYAGDTLKVFWPNGETEPAKYISNASTYTDCGYTLDGDGNIVVSADGVYTVKLWFDSTAESSGNHVTLDKTDDLLALSSTVVGLVDGGADGVVTATNALATVTAVSNDTDVATVDVTGSTITITPVAVGTTTITVTDVGEGHRLGTKVISVTVNASATVEYTLTWTVDWVWNDSAVVLAWVIGGTYGSGEWVEVTKVNATTITVEIDSTAGATKITLARFAPGTTAGTADWNDKYNQTDDVNLVGGTYNYSADTWH